MMDGVNRVTLLGNIGEPEVRVLPDGKVLLKLRIATNEIWVDRYNERKAHCEWHFVSVWGYRAEFLSKVLEKGDTVYVEGRLRTRSYEKNGERRYVTEILSERVIPGSTRPPDGLAPVGSRYAGKRRKPKKGADASTESAATDEHETPSDEPVDDGDPGDRGGDEPDGND